MIHQIFHYHPPFTSTTKSDQEYRDFLYLDKDEIDQRNEIDRKIIQQARDLEIIEEVDNKLIRREWSQSQPQSILLNTNYRYMLKPESMVSFFNGVTSLNDTMMDFHLRLGIGYGPELLDRLITRTYIGLCIVPTEDGPADVIGHTHYPFFWIYPYFKQRLHEVLSVGLPK